MGEWVKQNGRGREKIQTLSVFYKTDILDILVHFTYNKGILNIPSEPIKSVKFGKCHA